LSDDQKAEEDVAPHPKPPIHKRALEWLRSRGSELLAARNWLRSGLGAAGRRSSRTARFSIRSIARRAAALRDRIASSRSGTGIQLRGAVSRNPSFPGSETAPESEIRNRIYYVDPADRWLLPRDANPHETLEGDEASFRASLPPTGEEVRVPCIWVVELYAASHIQKLTRDLLRLVTNVSILRAINPHFDLADFLHNARRNTEGLWSRNTDFVVYDRSKIKKDYAAPDFSAALPADIDRVRLSIHHPFPSLTVIVAQFVVSRSKADGIVPRLRWRLFSGMAYRGRRGHSVNSWDLRRYFLAEYRARLRQQCVDWMTDRLPGAFAQLGAARHPLPAFDLLTFAIGRLENTDPSDPEEAREDDSTKARTDWSRRDRSAEDYIAALELTHPMSSWHAPDMPGISLHEPDKTEARRRARSSVLRTTGPLNPAHLTVAACLQQVRLPTSERHGRSEDEGTIIGYTGELSQTLSVLALDRLIGSYEDTLATIRDRLGQVPIGSMRRALKELQSLERDLALLDRDARPLMADVCASSPEQQFVSELVTFVRPDAAPTKTGSAPSLAANLLSDLIVRARRFLEAEEDTRRTVQGLSALTVGQTNLRLQRAAVLLALVAALLAALAVPQTVHDWFRHVFDLWWRF
jgi:hypothetical protein